MPGKTPSPALPDADASEVAGTVAFDFERDSVEVPPLVPVLPELRGKHPVNAARRVNRNAGTIRRFFKFRIRSIRIGFPCGKIAEIFQRHGHGAKSKGTQHCE